MQLACDLDINILIVEDDPVQRELLEKRLSALKYNIITAATGKEACEKIEQDNIDVVIMDWELPDIKGPDIVEKYSKNEEQLIPFILLTSHTDPNFISLGLDKGAFDYLSKPANNLELEARIRAALRFRILQKKYLEMANRDPLTGLYNRRYLDSYLPIAIEHSTYRSSSLVVGIADIDFFKKVNDNYGHDVGDIVLKQMAHHLTSNFRTSDIACRVGGEEFVIVMPDTTVEAAGTVVNRVLQNCRARRWGERDNLFSLSFSCGLAGLGANQNTMEKLLKKADENLYQAKSKGRSRVVSD